MINLTTGLPGAGKTLYTLAFVKALADKEHRPVFYSGINELALDWHEFEADKWMDCPSGAIIVIDECQRIFRPRGSGAKVPEYVSQLETHRHKGFDIFLVTQHPMLVDANVRRLTERHWHVARRFGFQRASIFEYQSCKDQPLANTANAQRSEWSYPKEVFGYYKSAEIHTVQRRVPVKWVLMILIPLFVIGAAVGWVKYRFLDGGVVQSVTAKTSSSSPVSSASEASSSTSSSHGGSDKPKPMTTQEYLAAYQPRIQGLAYTAPVYDKVTEPDEAPVPVACLSSKSQGCKCYSQQGTRLTMPDDLCMQIVKNGFFQSFTLKSQERKDRDLDRRQHRQEPQQVAVNQYQDPASVAPLVGYMPYSPPTLTPYRPFAGIGGGSANNTLQTTDQNDSTNPRLNPAVRPQ